MDSFVRVANRVGLTSCYLNDVEYYIKRNNVLIDPNYEYYLIETYNTIIDMLNTRQDIR